MINISIKKFAAVLLLLVCISISPLFAHGQKPPPDYQVKAAFLYNFTRFISWPPTAFRSANSPFIIGIIGNDPFGHYINEIVRGEKVGNHPIVIQRYYNLKDIVNCHLLFVNREQNVRDILSTVGQRNILTVSESDNFTHQGGMISFYKENNKVRFMVNLESSRAANIEISSKLLSIAKIASVN